MRIRIDPERCQGHSRCYAIAPDLFDADDYGTATVRHDGDVPARPGRRCQAGGPQLP